MKNEEYFIEEAVSVEQPLNSHNTFKYHDEIADLAGCPPSIEITPFRYGYRFYHNIPNHDDNYLPLHKIDGSRFLDRSKQNCCGSYALSFYRSEDALLAAAQSAVRRSPKFLKKLGDHYIKATLGTSAGRQVNLNDKGHFDLHEYNSFDLSKSIVAVSKI